jgi:hypothetical protein
MVILFTLSVPVFVQCTKDKALSRDIIAYCGTTPYRYDVEIKPLLLQYCATGQGAGTGCHDAWIGNYSSVIQQVENGAMEREVITTRDMPVPGNQFGIPPLPDSTLKMIECWLLTGAAQN